MDIQKDNTGKNVGTGFMTVFGQKIRDFGKRKDGVAAVEFAFVVPIMLSLYFGAMELSQGIEVNKKTGRATILIADLVTQQAVVTKNDIVSIAKIAAATLQPYNRSAPVVDLVGIQVSDELVPKARVAWSHRVTSGVGTSFLTVGDLIIIPPELLVRKAFVVKGEINIDYYPFTTYQINSITNGKKGIAIKEKYYLTPRMSTTVTCPDC